MLLLPSWTLENIIATPILIKQVHHDMLMSRTQGRVQSRGQTEPIHVGFALSQHFQVGKKNKNKNCKSYVFSQVHCNLGSLEIFPQQVSLLRDSKKIS